MDYFRYLYYLCSMYNSSFVLSLIKILTISVVVFGTSYTQGEKGYAPSSLSLWLALFRVLLTGMRELLSELKCPGDPLCAL